MKSNKNKILEINLINIFKLIFKLKEKKNFLNLKKSNYDKWDSLNHIKLMIYIENYFNIKFGVKKFNEVNSFKKIFSFLKTKKKL